MSSDELSMRIIQNIDIIEYTSAHIEQRTLPALFSEFSEVFRNFVDQYDLEANLGGGFDDGLCIYDPRWGSGGGNKPFLRIEVGNDTGPSGIESTSWLGDLCGYAESSINFFLGSHPTSRKSWRNLVMSERKFIRNLCKAGFQRDGDDGGNIWYPVKLDRNALASAFMTGDFSAALSPVELALQNIRSVWTDLDEMAAAIRSL